MSPADGAPVVLILLIDQKSIASTTWQLGQLGKCCAAAGVRHPGAQGVNSSRFQSRLNESAGPAAAADGCRGAANWRSVSFEP